MNPNEVPSLTGHLERTDSEAGLRSTHDGKRGSLQIVIVSSCFVAEKFRLVFSFTTTVFPAKFPSFL